MPCGHRTARASSTHTRIQVYDLHRIPIDGSSLDKPVVSSKWDKYGMSISPDGKSLAYIENDNSDRILIAPMDGSGAPRPLTIGATSQRGATFSPDGKWIAYEELSHGRPDVYVTSAEGSGGRRQVSVEGGEQPRWTRGGRELVYRRGDAMLAASVDPSTGRADKPVELFRKIQPYRLGGGALTPMTWHRTAVAFFLLFQCTGWERSQRSLL